MDIDGRLDHVAIATASLDGATAALSRFGLLPEGPDEEIKAGYTVVRCFSVGDALIELVTPIDDRSPLREFLDQHGPGLHHIALRVDDLDSEIERLQGEGAEFVGEPFTGRAGSRVAFLMPDEHTGMLVELVEHPG